MSSATPQRVLVVEDEQHLAEGLRFNLEAEGFQADVVDSGRGALDRLLDSQQHFDLVVLDVMLPDVDGFTVATELRQHQNFVVLSNISHQMHMSRMQIINNIGSSNYRYEYRPTYQYR